MRCLALVAVVYAVGTSAFPVAAADRVEPAGGALAGNRYRVIVSSDIGGSDPDDFQSMVHYLLYADLFDTEGLIASPPNPKGTKKDILAVIDAYEKGYSNLRRWSDKYPTPAALRAVTKDGAVDPAPRQGFSRPTEGSAWIIERAKVADPRALYVLVWGSATDVAQAVRDAPEIKSKIRVYYIGSWNTKQDPHARDYLFEQHPDLWLIESNTTFRGMYVGGKQDGDLGNTAFVRQHVQGHGALGEFFVQKKADIKMGDTPSVLYLLRGDPARPESPHWGGQFVKTAHGPHYWTDDPSPENADAGRPGAKTVSRWREPYLRDWQQRFDRALRQK